MRAVSLTSLRIFCAFLKISSWLLQAALLDATIGDSHNNSSKSSSCKEWLEFLTSTNTGSPYFVEVRHKFVLDGLLCLIDKEMHDGFWYGVLDVLSYNVEVGYEQRFYLNRDLYLVQPRKGEGKGGGVCTNEFGFKSLLLCRSRNRLDSGRDLKNLEVRKKQKDVCTNLVELFCFHSWCRGDAFA